ncbi:MAG: hypothetical protein H0T87_07275 [Gammaproteobacteria bacterium]|nr:hypothetical protein [Gammaproteobacteria bacterium]
MTDDVKLRNLYDKVAGVGNFEIIRDDAVFDAVLVSVGRFGIIYSVVLRAVPQYMLHEQRRLSTWQDVKESDQRTDGPALHRLGSGEGPIPSSRGLPDASP